MLDSIPLATQTSAQVLDPLQRQPDALDRSKLSKIDPLLEGNTRIVFGVDESASGPAVEECVAALTSPVMTKDVDRRGRIASIVKSTATEALSGTARRTWILAMDVTAVLAAEQGNEPLREAARQTGLALREPMDGGDIPFFNIWVERQLAAVSEMVISIRSQQSKR